MAERVPGIIVRTPNDTGIVAPPTFQRYPMIIGEGDPYKLVEDVRVVRSLGSVDDIPALSTINEIVSVGDLPGISKYTDAVDYNLVSGNRISWTPGGTVPTLGNSYYITYTETRAASAYAPILYFDENQVYEDHGGTVRNDGVINDISQGAALGFDNGAKGLMVLHLNDRVYVDPENPTNAELETAFLSAVDLLETITDWKLVLTPMSSGTLLTTTAAQILFNHAILASQPENKQERSVVMAMPQNTTYLQYATQAQAFANSRLVLPAIPSRLQMTGFAGYYDDRFYNAAVAGRACSVPIGINISDDIITGITFDDNFTPGVLRYLVQNGVSPAKSRAGVIRNVMFITTDTTNALTEDWGVQDVKDYVKKYWREGLWDLYRNKPAVAGLGNDIEGSSISILDKLIEDEVIEDYRKISAIQDSTEPRKFQVTGKVKPAFGVQWLDISFTFVLSFA